jgi:hypothetical protein
MKLFFGKNIKNLILFGNNFYVKRFFEKSKFSLKIEDDFLLDEEFKLLLEKNLKFETKSTNEKIVKTLLNENKELINKNNRLKYRIEHLINTIKSHEEELEKLKNNKK